MVVQWLRLQAPNAGGLGSIPSWGTKIPHAASCDHKKKKKESFFSSIKGAQNFQPLKRKRSKSCNFHLAT